MRAHLDRRVAWPVVLVAGAALLAGLAALAGRSADGVEPASQGRWMPVTPAARKFEMAVEGRISPVRTFELVSAAPGSLTQVNFGWGDPVRRGQVLARIDSAELLAQLRAAEAATLRGQPGDPAAQAGNESAQLNAARRRLLAAATARQLAHTRAMESRVLHEKGFVSRLDMESAAAEAEHAHAQLDVARDDLRETEAKNRPSQMRAAQLEQQARQAELQALRDRSRALLLRSPVDGVVLPPTAREGADAPAGAAPAHGARVQAGEAIASVADTSSFLVRAGCRESDLAWLEPHMPAWVSVTTMPGREFPARLIRLGVLARARAPQMERAGTTVPCEFELSPPPQAAELGRLRVGGSAVVRVSHTSAVLDAAIPLAALDWSPDGAARARWRAAPGAEPSLIEVRVLQVDVEHVRTDSRAGGEVWVPSPLPDGDRKPSILSRFLGDGT